MIYRDTSEGIVGRTIPDEDRREGRPTNERACGQPFPLPSSCSITPHGVRVDRKVRLGSEVTRATSPVATAGSGLRMRHAASRLLESFVTTPSLLRLLPSPSPQSKKKTRLPSLLNVFGVIIDLESTKGDYDSDLVIMCPDGLMIFCE
jgi:hypothetical protein